MSFNLEDNIKILYMSHSDMWAYFRKIEEENNNMSVDFYRGSTYYIKNRRQYEDCDFIIFFSSCGYADFEDKELKQLASRISIEKGKRVSVGYSYLIPKEKRTNLLKQEEIKIYSFKDGIEYEDTVNSPEYFTPINLFELVLFAHDELENPKTKKIGANIKIWKYIYFLFFLQKKIFYV